MTDYQELKRLAEALMKENSCAAATAFENALGPEEVLALLADIDQLRSAPIEDLFCCNLCQCMIQPANKLKAEVEALRKDAERYRWLRSKECWEDTQRGIGDLWIVSSREEVANTDGEFLDAAIDAAMSKESANGQAS